MRGVITTHETLIAAPADPAIDLDYARLHIKAISNVEDTLIAAWIEAATQYFEEYTGRQTVTATWELWLDSFPYESKIELPRPPLQDVESVQYVDGDGVVQSLTDGASPETPLYTVKAPVGPYATRGWVELNSGQSWPTTRLESGAVRIRFIAGYGDDATAVPTLVTAALCFLVGHFDQFRSEVHQTARGETLTRLPFGVQLMMDGFKYSALPSTVPRPSYWEPSRVSSWV